MAISARGFGAVGHVRQLPRLQPHGLQPQGSCASTSVRSFVGGFWAAGAMLTFEDFFGHESLRMWLHMFSLFGLFVEFEARCTEQV